ncbi:uncharacterized protein TM35_000084580 [Trypanosoma theileri]|uniref:Uncharacterized protein n=1 Tax=Trypanosoma theileri TaxID=67003 RepID=A0A1X0P2P8_9TRYP|nr:uncharacterized protein TM35_000084580 [Trypanosoma theileri]ORC90660.1 hypothetical protein TM35_000084580 [Trypanosoma theileri]
MKGLPIREVSRLSEKLQSSGGGNTKVQHIIAEGIRSRVLDKKTLPLLLQRLALTGNWRLSMQVVQSDLLDKHHIRREENIWKILEHAAPCEESRQTVRQTLRQLYARTYGPKGR